jgi:hypothetical protein
VRAGGPRPMPEAERVATLRALEEERAAALKELGALPLVIERPSVKKLRGDLEARLKELERAITTFSKSVVYIS